MGKMNDGALSSPVLWDTSLSPAGLALVVADAVSKMPRGERLAAMQRARAWADAARFHQDRWTYDMHASAARWNEFASVLDGAIQAHMGLWGL